MILKKKYEGIQDAMEYFKIQVRSSIPYCEAVFNDFNNIYDLYDFLKMNVTYKNDPGGNELFQTVRTLFENNIHGEPGCGDCDCFSILVTACCIVNNFTTKVVLVGKNKSYPSHIYNLVKSGNSWVPFDLTQPEIGTERKYKFMQELPVNKYWK